MPLYIIHDVTQNASIRPNNATRLRSWLFRQVSKEIIKLPPAHYFHQNKANIEIMKKIIKIPFCSNHDNSDYHREVKRTRTMTTLQALMAALLFSVAPMLLVFDNVANAFRSQVVISIFFGCFKKKHCFKYFSSSWVRSVRVYTRKLQGIPTRRKEEGSSSKDLRWIR